MGLHDALVKRQSKQPDLLKSLDEWLANQHCTLWGRSFEVQNDKMRKVAAEWLLDVLLDLREDQIIPADFFRRKTGAK